MEVAITMCLLAGVSSAVLARAKHRSVVGWFAIGTLFPLIGVVMILVLPSTRMPLIYPVAASRHHAISETIVAQRTHLQTATLDAVARLVQLKERGSFSVWEFQARRAEMLARI